MRASIASGGRITVPKAIRDYLGLRAGSTVQFVRLPSGDIVLRRTSWKRKSASVVTTRLRRRATLRMTTEEIMALTRDK